MRITEVVPQVNMSTAEMKSVYYFKIRLLISGFLLSKQSLMDIISKAVNYGNIIILRISLSECTKNALPIYEGRRSLISDTYEVDYDIVLLSG